MKSSLPLVAHSASTAELASTCASSGKRTVKDDWQTNTLAKLRGILSASRKNVLEIFQEFDTNNSGAISQVEFKNGIRKLNLGLTSREIDDLMIRLDTNGDGKIDIKEFTRYMGVT